MIGTPVGVQQKLMRRGHPHHDEYGDAVTADMAEAHGKIASLAPIPRRAQWLGDIAALPLHDLVSRFVSETPFHGELQYPWAIERIDDKQRAEPWPGEQIAVLVRTSAVPTG
jgi:hypothetical protein